MEKKKTEKELKPKMIATENQRIYKKEERKN